MIKMDMVWVAVAKLIYPDVSLETKVSKKEIDSEVYQLFQTKITPVMINMHLVNSVDRQADMKEPRRGGSRKRYLVKDKNDYFRLYKTSDGINDGWEKTGPFCPAIENVNPEYKNLVIWYEAEYIESGG